MLKKITCLIAIVGFTIITGCTTAGPFVSNISSDGQGNLIIEKSSVKLNSFTGTVSNDGGSTTTIRILPEENYKRISNNR